MEFPSAEASQLEPLRDGQNEKTFPDLWGFFGWQFPEDPPAFPSTEAHIAESGGAVFYELKFESLCPSENQVSINLQFIQINTTSWENSIQQLL